MLESQSFLLCGSINTVDSNKKKARLDSLNSSEFSGFSSNKMKIVDNATYHWDFGIETETRIMLSLPIPHPVRWNLQV